MRFFAYGRHRPESISHGKVRVPSAVVRNNLGVRGLVELRREITFGAREKSRFARAREIRRRISRVLLQ